MKLVLKTNFEIDIDSKAGVRFHRDLGGLDDVCAAVEIDYNADNVGKHTITFYDLGLKADALTQARLMLAAAELINSFVSEGESVYEIEL